MTRVRYAPVRMTRNQNIQRQPSFSVKTPAMTGPKLGAAPPLTRCQYKFRAPGNLSLSTYNKSRVPTYPPRSSIVVISATIP